MEARGETDRTIRGYVTRIALEPQRARRGDYLFRGLEILSETDAPRTFLIIPESVLEFGRPDLYGFPGLCWEGAEIAAFKAQLNNTLEDGSTILVVTPETELVLEPFRPVSVTEAVEAAGCIRLVDLRYRVAPDEPIWMAKGRMVHSLFGYLLHHGREVSLRHFTQAFRHARKAILEVVAGSGVPVNEQDLEEEARRHFMALREWLERNGLLLSSSETEVDRISTRWGLKGRADAVFYGEDCDTIVELKSGRVPVEDHLIQLCAYGLLFELDQGRRSTGYLVYSGVGKTQSMRDTGRWSILDGRNRVIWLKHSHTLQVEQDRKPEAGGVCPRGSRCFANTRCSAFYGDVSSGKKPFLTGSERQYYDRWFRLLSVDAWESETRLARVLDTRTLTDRVAEGLTVPVAGLSFSDEPQEQLKTSKGSPPRPKSTHEPLATPESLLNLPGRKVVAYLQLELPSVDVGPGDEVILHRGEPCAREALRAKVLTHDQGQIAVLIKTPLLGLDLDVVNRPMSKIDQADGPWFLDRIPFARAREVSRQALFRFFTVGSPQVIQAVVNGSVAIESEACPSACVAGKPTAHESGRIGQFEQRARSAADGGKGLQGDVGEDLCFSEGLHSELNEEQEEAVRAALESEPFHLIHGPPGTGKTRVLARLVRICLDRGERVLVACPTNVALDRLLIALVQLGVREFLRIGGRSSVSDEFFDALAGLGNPPVLFEDLLSRDMSLAAFKKKVVATRLVGATAYQCAAHPLFIRQRFDRAVIDEAGQLDEPSSLGVLALARRFVLGGDHLQLPPVVQSAAGETDAGYALERSLFERMALAADPSRISRLKTQYRMSKDIQELPSRLFYDGTLYPAPEVVHRRLRISPGVSDDEWLNRTLDPELPVVFLDVKGPNAGKARPEEAVVAARIVEGLIACGIPAQEIGVITPYRVQQALIRRRLLDSRRGALISVDTVDRFQGGEREVIILSLSRSDGVTSFLADRKRLNVSLSRARSKLILLGHASMLEGHPLFASLLDGLERIPVHLEA